MFLVCILIYYPKCIKVKWVKFLDEKERRQRGELYIHENENSYKNMTLEGTIDFQREMRMAERKREVVKEETEEWRRIRKKNTKNIYIYTRL